jgi:hypothetical protein
MRHGFACAMRRVAAWGDKLTAGGGSDASMTERQSAPRRLWRAALSR